jgi:hypothetical protein
MLLLTHTPATEATTANREQWLNLMANKYIRPMFASKGYTIPTNVRLSCSLASGGIHTKKHQKRFTLGECYSPTMSGDNTIEIMIVPTLADSSRVIDVLVHELCHATVGNVNGHNSIFGACARAVGLEGKLTSTKAGEWLSALIAEWIKAEGEYPHATLSTRYKKQSTRMYKCDCACGYTMRISSKWLKIATPRCPLGHGDMSHEFMATEGEDYEGEE